MASALRQALGNIFGQTPEKTPMASTSAPLYSPVGGYGTQVGGHSYVETPTGGQWSTVPASQAGFSAPTSGVPGTPGTPGAPNGERSLYQDVPTQEEATGPSMAEIDAAFSLGEQAIRDYQATLQPAYETGVESAQAGAELQKGEARTEEARRIGGLEAEEAGVTTRGESAIAESRRQVAELQKGIQARFGGTTGTGQFVSEQVGGAGLRNIGQNRAVLNETLGKIGLAKDAVREKTTELVERINNETKDAVSQLKIRLDQQMAEINSRVADLAMNKATLRMQVLQESYSLRDRIQQSNTDFTREIYLRANERQEQLSSWSQEALQQFEAYFEKLQPTKVGDTGYYAMPKLSGVQYLKGSEEEEEVTEVDPITGEPIRR